MRLIVTPAAKAISKLARPASSSCRVRPAACMQRLSYHSTAAIDLNQSSLRRADAASIRDPDLDALNFGYRVVVTVPPALTSNRSYATSSFSTASIGEDYDEYTLYGEPSESAHCDLGAMMGGGGQVDIDTILQFDDAGCCRPIWETRSGGDSFTSSFEGAMDWTLQSHNDNRSHETTEQMAVMDDPVDDDQA